MNSTTGSREDDSYQYVIDIIYSWFFAKVQLMCVYVNLFLSIIKYVTRKIHNKRYSSIVFGWGMQRRKLII